MNEFMNEMTVKNVESSSELKKSDGKSFIGFPLLALLFASGTGAVFQLGCA